MPPARHLPGVGCAIELTPLSANALQCSGSAGAGGGSALREPVSGPGEAIGVIGDAPPDRCPAQGVWGVAGQAALVQPRLSSSSGADEPQETQAAKAGDARAAGAMGAWAARQPLVFGPRAKQIFPEYWVELQHHLVAADGGPKMRPANETGSAFKDEQSVAKSAASAASHHPATCLQGCFIVVVGCACVAAAITGIFYQALREAITGEEPLEKILERGTPTSKVLAPILEEDDGCTH